LKKLYTPQQTVGHRFKHNLGFLATLRNITRYIICTIAGASLGKFTDLTLAMKVTAQLEIANLIREIRSRLGLTQEKFAHHLGVTYLTVSRWENGRTSPSPMALKLIEGVLQKMGDRGRDLLVKYFPGEG